MATLKITGKDPIGAARNILLLAGIEVVEERAVPFGVQFRLDGGMANVYSTGAVVPQGAKSDSVRRVFEDAIRAGGEAPTRAPAPAPRRVIKAASTLQPPAAATPAESTSRRHPKWSNEPWDGVTPPFDVD